jgi:hypothetical protein
MPSSPRRAFLVSLLPACFVLGGMAAAARGQDSNAPLPPPAEHVFETKDGVKLAATYLQSTKGKDSPVVILLHMFKGNRRDMLPLGELLQKQGCAVIMPDLRGHGDSTTVVIGGSEKKFDAATMPPAQFGNMVTQDMEAVKKFLVEENNAGRLNIERLGIVAAEMSVQVAVKWTTMDWAWPVLPTVKQGQDVKAIVMLSPTTSFRNLNISQDMQNPQGPMREKISILMVCGAEDRTSVTDARRFHQLLSRFRPTAEKIEDKTLFIDDSLKTKLAGTKLLGENLGVEDLIAQFIDLRLKKPTFPWKDRSTK